MYSLSEWFTCWTINPVHFWHCCVAEFPQMALNTVVSCTCIFHFCFAPKKMHELGPPVWYFMPLFHRHGSWWTFGSHLHVTSSGSPLWPPNIVSCPYSHIGTLRHGCREHSLQSCVSWSFIFFSSSCAHLRDHTCLEIVLWGEANPCCQSVSCLVLRNQ